MKKICIIDDDRIYRTIVLGHLARMAKGCDIVSMEDGEDAINKIKKMIIEQKNLPDLILLDINMPIMDGWDFLDEFREIKTFADKKIHIVIVTSSVDDRDMSKASEYEDVAGYMVKPVISADLKRVIDRFLSVTTA